MAHPFSKEDKTQINKTLKDIENVKKDIAKAKSAGLDVTASEQRILEAEKKLRAIKQVYFPGE